MRVGDTQYGGNLDLNYNKIINLTAKRRAAPLVDRDSNLELIGMTELSADAASIEFANIPGRYRHLLILSSCRGSVAATVEEARIRFNGDTGANYDAAAYSVNDSATLFGSGEADGPGITFIQYADQMTAANSPTSAFAPVAAFIPDYSNTTRHKSKHSMGGYMAGTAAGDIYVASSSGRWRSTNAITKVTILPASGNLVSGSVVSLYGIRSKRFLVDPTDTLCNSLIAYWKLNETGGTRLDSWGANHLTDNNTVTYSPGLRGNAAQFAKGNSEYLSGGDNADLSTGNIDFTIACWVKLYETSGGYAFATKMDSASVLEYRFRYDTGFQLQIFESGGPLIAGATSSSASTGLWYFVVAHHDAANDQIGVQVNNGAVTTASTGGTGPSDTAADFGIGAEVVGGTPDTFMHGLIQNIGFWKKVLTPAERTALFNQGKGNTLVAA